MANPEYNISQAFLFSPKSETDGVELDVPNNKKVFAQNLNKSQGNLAYFWSSAGLEMNLESQNDTAISVANYVFENILADRSNTDQHTATSDLYIVDRIDPQNNTKHLGNKPHKGVLFFVPSFTNNSRYVSLQLYGMDVMRLYKRNINNVLVDLEPNDILADGLCMIAYDYTDEVPCYVLYGMFSNSQIQNIVGKYTVDTKLDLTTQNNNTAFIGQIVLNTGNGTLTKDKVEINENTVNENCLYNVFRIDNDGTIHYHKSNIKAGDIIFVKSNKVFYYFDGNYLLGVGSDGKQVFDAYTDNGTTIMVNTDKSDLVYINNVNGNRTITLSGTPNHLQKCQVFLNITVIVQLAFSNVSTWLEGNSPTIIETGVYPLCFVYDSNLQKWIGNTQGFYK